MFIEVQLSLIILSIYVVCMTLTVFTTLVVWIKTKRNHKAYGFLMTFYALFSIGAINLFSGMHTYSHHPLGNVFNMIFTFFIWSLAFISFVISLWFFIKPHLLKYSDK
ncbi:hypothetical protein [Pontibacillus sp. HMF3514]|uniref:hypothetical protein n=1 Tax=Pontibacillus sp. HMF3514 TaxID=2692425 RepID=UPI00132003C6|nr:hypothetical protein [Pontibacillus sp. HMF3514]QHE52654.1 hypothetical protein GS400_11700 [Pontibacillus sp. HMF3514]